MSEIPPPRLKPRKPPLSQIGSAVVALGWLIVGLCGLCSLGGGALLVSMGLGSGRPERRDLAATLGVIFESLGPVVLIGGLPIGVGVGLIVWGLTMRDDGR